MELVAPEHLERLRNAERALAEEQWEAAIGEYEALLSELPGAFLPVPESVDTLEPLWRGVARRLQALPPSARDLYVSRALPRLRQAVDLARRVRDPDALVEAARAAPTLPACREVLREAAYLYLDRGRPDRASSCIDRFVDGPDVPLSERDARILRVCSRMSGEPFPEGTGRSNDLDPLPLPEGLALAWSRGLPEIPEGGMPERPWVYIAWDEVSPRQNPDRPAGGALLLDGRLLTGGSWGILALDPNTGDLLWTAPCVGSPGGSVSEREIVQEAFPLAAEGSGGMLFAVRPVPGGGPAPVRIPNPLVGAPFVPACGEIVALDPASGEPVWSIRTNGLRFMGTPVLVGRDLLVPAIDLEDGTRSVVLQVDPVTGGLQGRIPLGRPRTHRIGSFVSLLSDGRRLFVSTNLGLVAEVDRAWGRVRWIHTYGLEDLAGFLFARGSFNDSHRRGFGWLPTSPVRAGDRLLVAPVDSDRLLCLDPETGRKVWSVSIPSPGVAKDFLGVHNGTVVVVTDALVGINLDTGEEGWRSLRLPTVGGRGILDGDRAWIPTAEGIEIVSLAGGSWLAHLPWPEGTGPGNLVSDGQRLFVVNDRSIACLLTVGTGLNTLPDDLPVLVRDAIEGLVGPEPGGRDRAEDLLARSGEVDRAFLERLLGRGLPDEASRRLRRLLRARKLQTLLAERAGTGEGVVLLDRVADRDARTRAGVLRALCGLDPRTSAVAPEARLDVARLLLEDSSGRVRVLGYDIAQRSHEEEGLELLLGAVNDPSLGIRRRAVAWLGEKMRHPPAREALLDIALHDEIIVSREAIRYLAVSGETSGEEYGRLFAAPGYFVHLYALMYLEGLSERRGGGFDGVVPALARFVLRGDLDPYLHGMAIAFLVEFGREEALGALRALRDRSDRMEPIVRLNVAVALAELGHPDPEGLRVVLRDFLRELGPQNNRDVYREAVLLLSEGGDRAAAPLLLGTMDMAAGILRANPRHPVQARWFGRAHTGMVELTGHRPEGGEDPQTLYVGWVRWWDEHGHEFPSILQSGSEERGTEDDAGEGEYR